MKAKRKYRILALVLAVLMVSSTVLANGTIRVAATEEEAVEKITAVDADSAETSDQGEATAASEAEDAEGTAAAGSTSNGVINGADATDADSEAVDAEKTIGVTAEQVDGAEVDVNLTKDAADSETADVAAIEYDEDEAVKVIIVFEGDSAVESDNTLEAGSGEANEVVADLEAAQEEVIAEVEAEVLDGEALEVEYQYTWLLNGVATTVPAGAISAIEAIDGVKGVYIQEMYQALTEEEEDADVSTDSYDTLLAASGTMIGREEVWADGYTGAGIKVAVIDTGLDTDHRSFAALDESALTEDSADLSTIENVLTQLNAYANYGPSLSAEKLYISTKIAYAFNYCDENLDVTHDNDTQGDHGTHVAGIVAANAVEGTDVVGVAPDAQLYIMKVFGSNGGAYTEDIIAALEDAVLLGADVINMSLGSDSGFSSSEDEVENQVYETIGKTGIILTVSAGNSATAGSSNLLGYDSYLTENPDNGIVSSPATYESAISVASVNNVGETGYYIEADGQEFIYSEGSNGSNKAMSTLYGETFEFVMIPNYGESADYEGLDVEGKVAVVSRGSTSFIDKQAVAEEAGAVAILVYNNVTDTITADLTDNTATIPFATITQAAGAAMQEIYDAAVASGEAATLWFSDVSKVVTSDFGYEMSYFSSWGTTNDLKIEPDITAPGGNIYSTLVNDNYGTYSGTSMSSPMVAGMAALIKQYITETNLLTAEDEDGTEVTEEGLNVSELATALLLSTAAPISYDEDTFYSPRLQGNGLANVLNAVRTTAYISYADETEPQAELGDDPEKTGSYSYTFDVVNFGDTTLYYDSITTSVQTEDYLEGDDGNTYMASTPVNLDAETSADGSIYISTYDYDEDGQTIAHDARLAYLTMDEITENEQFRYDLDDSDSVNAEDVQAYLDALTEKNADVDLTEEVAAVKAGETTTVTVEIQVTEDGMAWMDEHFANGIYVEGYTILTAKGEGVDLAIPYLAFYGDWTSAPMLDDGGYSYLTAEAEEATVSQYYNILWTNYMGEDDSWVPGLNPYLDEDVIDPSHVSLSPDGDGYADYVSNIYVSLLRNAETLTFTFADAEDETNVYSETTFSKVVKSTYYSGYGICLPFVLTWYNGNEFWYCTDADGNTLENNDKVTMTVAADLGYTAHEADTTGDVWTETITIDLEAPQLDTDQLSVEIAEDGTQTLTLTFSDNVDVAAVNFVSKAGSVLAQVAVEQPETQGDSVTASYDITGYGNSFYVVLGDYAMNESYWLITTTDNLPVLDESLLYGYRTYDDNYSTDTVYGWLSIDPDTGESVVLDSEYYMDYAITAATYVDGYILAVAADYQLYAITPGLWDEWTWIADIGVAIRTLTYDPAEHCLWGFCGSSGSYGLYHIDVETGESYRVSTNYTIATAIACAEDGTLYGITTGGYLRTLDKETGKWITTDLNVDLRTALMEQTDLTAVSLSYQQSMVYDAEDDCLYWAAYSYGSGGIYGGLVRLDVDEVTVESEEEDGEAATELEVTLTVIDTIAGNAEVAGLLKLEAMGDYTLPEVEDLTALSIQESNVKMTVGGTTSLTAICTPWYAKDAEIFWSSSDDSVATVDASGKVTALSVGECVISVTNADGTLTGTCTVYVLNPDAELYGFAVYSENLYNQWITFTGDAVGEYEVLTDERISSFIAAEYYDGNIYAYAENGTFYRIDAETFEETELGTWEGMEWGTLVLDMAFDYSTGYMYAICDDYSLYAVDLLNGHLTWMAEIYDYKDGMAQTLAVDLDGTVYFITETGFLCTYDWEEDWTTEIGLVDATMYTYNQSMAFDYATGYLYWAAYGTIYYVDTESGATLSLGAVDSDLQIVGLFTLPDESILPELGEIPVTSVELTEDSVTLLTGMTTTVPVEILPLNATDRNIVWTVEDPEIAVIESSVITGLAAGTTTAVGTLGDFTVELEITVIASAGTLYGYIVQDMSMGTGDFWASFSDNALSSGGTGILLTDNYEVYSGEYYNGKVYAFGMDADSSDYAFMVLDAETFEEEEYWVGGYPSFREMAFDYTTGTLYAVGNARNSTADSYLYMIDTENGNYYTVAQSSASLYGLACAEDGTMYAIDSDGILYTMDKATAELTEIGDTGYMATLYQSLAFDYDTGNLYWAQASSVRSGWSYTSSYDFLLVNTEDASVIKLGTIGESGCQVTALFSIPDKEMTVGTPEATGMVISTSDEVLNVGEIVTLTAKFMPISVNSYGGEIAFTSSDPAVASVDNTGLVTALAKGSATVTASSGSLSVSCKITVLDETSVLYVASANGMESAQVYAPGTIVDSVSYPDGFPTVTNTAYNIEDELYYAVDEDGCLWTYKFDGETFSEVTQVSAVPIAEQLDNADYFDGSEPAELIDLTVNTFNNKLYALVEGHIAGRYMDYNEYYIYEIDTATGAATAVSALESDSATPVAFVFTAEDYIVWYDYMISYIYGQTLSLDDPQEESLAWVQYSFCYNSDYGPLSMVYSPSMNRIFFAGVDYWGLTGSSLGLYEFNVTTNTLTLVGTAAYDKSAFDLITLE